MGSRIPSNQKSYEKKEIKIMKAFFMGFLLTVLFLFPDETASFIKNIKGVMYEKSNEYFQEVHEDTFEFEFKNLILRLLEKATLEPEKVECDSYRT